MFVAAIRTILIYVIVVIVLRLMGKRQIGQLQPFELVVLIMISDMASIPSQNPSIPLLSGLIPVIVLLTMSVGISQLILKSEKARSIICGSPTILIAQGKIVEKELRNLRYNLSDLLEQLRVDGISNIASVDYAILETNGQLSVIPKAAKRPVTPEDLQVEVPPDGLALTLIMDGVIQSDNMQKAGFDQKWIDSQLKKHKLHHVRQILIASLDRQGNLYFQAKEKQQ